MKRAIFLIALVALVVLPTWGIAQESRGYKMPPKAMADLVDAPSTPSVSFSPDEDWLLLMQPKALPTIKELSQTELRIAGLRINPRTNGRSRARHIIGMTLKRLKNGEEFPVGGFPEDALLGYARWSIDGQHLAVSNTTEKGIELWVISLKEKKARKLTRYYLNEALGGGSFSWLSDNKSLLCKFVPDDRGKAPQAPEASTGPIIQENIGKVAPARTYQDLLKNPYDEKLFEFYTTSQLATVNLNGKVTRLGVPAIINSVSTSPDGKYILKRNIHRPYSYVVPVYRFPYKVEIVDLAGKLVKEIADLPLEEEVVIHFDAVVDSPRSFGWRQDVGASIYWVKAQDGGNPFNKAEIRDRVFVLEAPFSGKAKELVALESRFGGITWGDSKLALVTERWRKTRKVKTWKVAPDSSTKKELLWDRSTEDRYSDPGRPLMKTLENGSYVLRKSLDGGLFLSGSGATPKGNRPFISKLDLATKEVTELWRNNDEFYENIALLLKDSENVVLTRRESVTEPPNYFRRDISNGKLTQITQFPHPTPQLIGVAKELVKYKRADGVDLSGTLYLPAGYKKEDGPLPMLMWAYPREFKSASAAGQISGSPYSFVRVRPTSPLVFLAHGYAVFSGPTMPIIGEGDKEPNDTFREQLVASAKAAVDVVVKMGVADPKKIAVGGHSYGAFMTANLLAHSDLFATGIARSGAYNRTLTPFGFQSEERTYWQAPEIYNAMAPFMHADKVNEPILLIHGEADNNSGTFPIQSKRYYSALKGHGTTARLVMLPNESHGYRARESLMHMLWEMATWLDTYVKNVK